MFDHSGDGRRSASRRSLLRTIGAVAASALTVGTAAGRDRGGPVRVSQGDGSVRIAPVRGDVPVERLYGYALPEQYVGTGVVDTGSGSSYDSIGTAALQREATTLTFVYDGPNGRSIVIVHGDVTTDSPGGAASFAIAVDGSDPEWLVRDDYYRNAETGEPPGTNFDEWRVDGSTHTVHWTWGPSRTDGGALGYLSDATVEIDPSFNEAAELYGEYYDGRITDWHFLSGDLSDPNRLRLDLGSSLQIDTGASARGTSGDDERRTDRERVSELRAAVREKRERVRGLAAKIRALRRELRGLRRNGSGVGGDASPEDLRREIRALRERAQALVAEIRSRRDEIESITGTARNGD